MHNWAFWRAASFLMILLLVITCGLALGRPQDNQTNDEDFPWAFQRGDIPIEPTENLVELVAVGDINLGRGVDPTQAFNQSTAWLRAADVAMANLECSISESAGATDAEETTGGPYWLIAHPQSAQALKNAGFDLVGLANNHSLDAGPAGLEETVGYLRSVGVAPVGAGQDRESAFTPVMQTIQDVTVAFLAFNGVPSPDPLQQGWRIADWDEDESLAAVRRASILADAVVVSIHWGYEYERRADPGQQVLAQAMIAAGADLVIGHHPHVVQEVLLQQRTDGSTGLAALSLGNFAFDQGHEDSQHGLTLRAFFDQDGLRGVQMLPVQAGLLPRLNCQGGPSCPDSRLPLIQMVQPAWEKIVYTCQPAGCSETYRQTTKSVQPGGIFQKGEIDLTGDQQVEEIRLTNGRIHIFEQGRLAWTTPPEWRVLDLALGDPDGDGRSDLILAMQKPDQQGHTQSHPFVIGYRGGVYRTVWGGSAVSDPLSEVEFGDIDEDGETELIVLEEDRGGQGRAVTVWHWHGWGFALDWRSAYGQYENMLLTEEGLSVDRLMKKTAPHP